MPRKLKYKDQTKINTKKSAINAKDTAYITAKQVTIPFLAKPYTENQLKQWLKYRTDILDDFTAKNNNQIKDLEADKYDALDSVCKPIVDKILTHQDYFHDMQSITTGEQYDAIIWFIIYRNVNNDTE